MSDETVILLPDGSPARMGCIQPETQRFAAVPAWSEANPVLPESEWQEHDDYAHWEGAVKYQQHNNCTCASLAGGGEILLRAAGIACPDLSMSFLYALHNGGRDAGAMCRDLVDDFRKRGMAPASLVPESQIYPPRGGFSPEVYAEAQKYRALEVYQCLNFADVASALTRRFVVYHGFVLGRAFMKTGKDGKVPAFDGQLVNGHAMRSRGLTKKFGDWRTITPNTWSASFGDKGIGYIPASYYWLNRGNYTNLDCFAMRSAVQPIDAPSAT